MPSGPLLLNVLFWIATLALGYWFGRNKRRALWGLAVGAMLGLAAWLFWRREDWFVRVFPVANALFFDNWFPYAAAVLGMSALAFAKDKHQRLRMAVLIPVLLLIPWWPIREFWRAPAMSAGTFIDENGVCRQTSLDTCSAAAVVTLLREFDIVTTEIKAARLAMTKARAGTRALGVYRALKLLTRQRPGLRVRYRARTVEELLEMPVPAIIAVGLPKKGLTQEQLDFGEQYQWEPGVFHDVILYGPAEKEGFVKVADPDFGMEHWPVEHLEALYQGRALWLESREGNAARANAD